MVLAGEEKIEEFAKPRTAGRRVSYEKIGLTTVAVTLDLLSRMPLTLKIEHIRLGTVYYLNQDNPVPNCPNSYDSLHARRPSIQKTGAIGQFKRRLNSDPPSHRGK